MPDILLLPKSVSELIAAGEVVERPSSVVKELLENAIDAGATAITLEIRRGGITYIRITDNGCGISRANVPAAFLSHATSKVRTAEDLNAIYTLGFRGEALASIAAVSRAEMLTRVPGEEIGTRYVIEGSVEKCCSDAGCPVGTTIVVRDLFYNTPARMKFLKKDVSEANAVAGVMDRIALSHPEISFRFIREGKETLLTPGDDQLSSAIRAVYGKEFAAGMLPVDHELNRIHVSGYISKPVHSRGNRAMQTVFLNGRYVRSGTATAAVEEAYKRSIMVGRFPAFVLNIDVPRDSVDINVHPAKIEVRFSNEKAIFDAVYYAVRNTLDRLDTRPQMDLSSKHMADLTQPALPRAEQIAMGIPEQAAQKPSRAEEQAQAAPAPFVYHTARPQAEAPGKQADADYTVRRVVIPEASARTDALQAAAQVVRPPSLRDLEQMPELPKSSAPAGETAGPVPERPAGRAANPVAQTYRVIGEAFQTYIIVECGKELYFIDKHAAHERMLFEKLKAEQGDPHSQLLLKPVPVPLSKEEYAAVLEGAELLRKAGFDIEDFGSGSILVRSCPLHLSNEEIEPLFTETARYLMEHRHEIEPAKLDWLYHNVACRSAIKAGDRTSRYELDRFVERLLSDDSIRYCPHGRPVRITLTRSELEKQFGRE